MDDLPAPQNDNFAESIRLEGTNASSLIDSVITATKELGEPDHAGRTGGHSIWWMWSAPESRTMTLRVQTNGSLPILAVYTGDTLSNLVSISSAVGSVLTFDALSGTAYRFALDWDGDLNIDANAEIELFRTPAPLNNDFVQPASLVGYHDSFSGTTAGADVETGEPGLGLEHSVWFSWTSPDSGTANLKINAPSFLPSLAVFTGESLANLTPLTSPLDTNLTFSVVAGTSYYLLLDVAQGSSGSFDLDLSIVTPPSNDQFEQRRPLGSISNVIFSSTSYATTEANETLPARATGRTVWWTWTAPSNETVFVSTIGSSFAPLVSVYVGDAITNLSLVASNSYIVNSGHGGHDDERASVIIILPPPGGDLPPMPPAPPQHLGLTNTFSFMARRGLTYQFSVDGLNGNKGDVVLSFSSTPLLPPLNDNFVDRILLLGEVVSVNASNSFATKEVGEPDHDAVVGGASVWWSCAAPGNGRVRLTAMESGFSPLIAIYRGEQLSNLLHIASGRAAVDFDVTGGEVYQFAFDGENGADGNFSFNVKFYPPPANDNFLGRAELLGSAVSTTGHNVGATIESAEAAVLSLAVQHSVWWTWTAPSNGRANISVTANFPVVTAVCSGTALDRLTPLVTGNSSLFFLAEAGTEYQIAVASRDDSVGDIGMNLVLVDTPANDLFANRMELSGRITTGSGTTLNATLQRGEPLIPHSLSGASVWYTWTAPSSGPATIMLADGSPGQSFAVYVGSKLSSLLRLAQAPNEGYYGLRFYACEGVSYQIEVADEAGFEGDFGLQIVGALPPPGQTSSAPPTFSADGFALHITGANGQSFVVEASTDLSRWTVIGVDTIFLNSQEFLDVNSKDFAHRFYRVRPLEVLFSSSTLAVAAGPNSDSARFQVEVKGRAGDPFVLESSSDLQSWSELSRGTIIGEAVEYFDPVDASTPHRFYRAVPLQ